ncbi:hypothetical protein [Legionella jordanis]|nr:hypothetical protein [Legionella jordanis]RMX18642.1 hypothetical protein EAS68_07440 [Legionella jordanis]
MGFLTSQLQHSPHPFISALANLASLFFNSIAYGLWLAAAQLYPDYPRKKDHWYGFAEIKKQHLVAAAIGALAIVVCIAGIVIPPFLVLGSWLFFTSNLFWCIAEYHKQKNPPGNDLNFSVAKQEAYVRYAILNTLITLIPAVTATIALFFPPAALLAFVASVTLGICLGSVSIYCWFEYNCLPESKSQKGSYAKSMRNLGALQPSIDKDPVPEASNSERYLNRWQPLPPSPELAETQDSPLSRFKQNF